MFDSGLDTERMFGHSRVVSRIRVRRRRLAAGALLVLALSVSAPAVSAAVTGGSSRRAAVADRYVVRAGDTLWSIAVSRAPGTDPRRVVQAIVDANQADAGTLVPGQVLVIPA
jgi:nucleoid-associated protein YgaU